MLERVPWGRLDVALRIVAAVVGTVPFALGSSVLLARFLAADEETRFAVGFTLVIPLWVGAMCVAFLSHSGKRACLVCGALAWLLWLSR